MLESRHPIMADIVVQNTSHCASPPMSLIEDAVGRLLIANPAAVLVESDKSDTGLDEGSGGFLVELDSERTRVVLVEAGSTVIATDEGGTTKSRRYRRESNDMSSARTQSSKRKQYKQKVNKAFSADTRVHHRHTPSSIAGSSFSTDVTSGRGSSLTTGEPVYKITYDASDTEPSEAVHLPHDLDCNALNRASTPFADNRV